jgi:hypothetical protein
MNHWSTVERFAADHRADLLREASGSWRLDGDEAAAQSRPSPRRFAALALARGRAILRSVVARAHVAAATSQNR